MGGQDCCVSADENQILIIMHNSGRKILTKVLMFAAEIVIKI